MNPTGGGSFEQLHRLGQREVRRKNEKKVNVVCHAADFEGLHVVFTGYATEIRPETFADGFG